jgi:hypothetical protein|tara:strand:- start:912 stop:1430 length:519 start_codon:yes stop_codon:yes gene_type:complete
MSKKYKVYKSFISKEDCDLLNEWVLENKIKFSEGRMKGMRLTSRYSFDIEFPKKAYEIRDEIIKKLNFTNYSFPPYKDGMVSSFAAPGDTCYLHKDPVWETGTTTIHCNILLSDSEGGEPLIENDKLDLKKGDLWMYPVSEVKHGADLVKGEIPRTLWIFGFCFHPFNSPLN